ncbi:MAG: exosortase [Nitrospira sp.]|nr:exosortase [bacterium]MBL7049574.1 exosortase [Nitrospira sp.]
MNFLNSILRVSRVKLDILVLALLILLYESLFLELYMSKWEFDGYTQAYAILPITTWLIWRQREVFHISERQYTSIETIGGGALLFAGVMLYLLGSRFEYLSISALSLIPVAFGTVITLYSIKTAAKLSFPILYMLLLVPPPTSILDSLTLSMRHGVSVATAWTLQLLNYPITRKGLMLNIGDIDIYMGEPCSGFRSLITLFSLMLAYIYIRKTTLYRKLILSLFIVPMALLGNLIRVITVCLLTYYFGEEIGQGFFHWFSGMLIFSIMLLGMISIEKLIEKVK